MKSIFKDPVHYLRQKYENSTKINSLFYEKSKANTSSITKTFN
jgi:hypothetical protein